MNTRACRQALLAAAVLLAAALPLQAIAASVSFDFTGGLVADSLLDAGNDYSFESAGISVHVRGFERDSAGVSDNATVVSAAADYSGFGFSVASDAEGLGICSSADGKFKNCLKKADKFAAGTNTAEEWYLLVFDAPLRLESFTVNIVGNSEGRIDYFAGNVDPNTLTVANYRDYFDEQFSFSYDRRAGSQVIDLALLQTHNALLIGADAGAARFMLTEARATVVPVPPALLLFASALFAIGSVRAIRR